MYERIRAGEIWPCELHETSDPRQSASPGDAEFPGGGTSGVHAPHATPSIAVASEEDARRCSVSHSLASNHPADCYCAPSEFNRPHDGPAYRDRLHAMERDS